MDQIIHDFLAKERVCVLATPHASAMHFTFDESSNVIYLMTRKGSRKLERLELASLVVGFSEQEWITVQLDGKIETILGTESIKNLILKKYPEEFKHMNEETVFLAFSPTWWRYSDLKNNLLLENK
jgi:uncharacterized protein YhbP (UPF0306 family)